MTALPPRGCQATDAWHPRYREQRSCSLTDTLSGAPPWPKRLRIHRLSNTEIYSLTWNFASPDARDPSSGQDGRRRVPTGLALDWGPCHLQEPMTLARVASAVRGGDGFRVSSGQGAGWRVKALGFRVSSWAASVLCVAVSLSRLLSPRRHVAGTAAVESCSRSAFLRLGPACS